jgi:hypothetical protein
MKQYIFVILAAILVTAVVMGMNPPDSRGQKNGAETISTVSIGSNPIHDLYWYFMCQEGSEVCPDE